MSVVLENLEPNEFDWHTKINNNNAKIVANSNDLGMANISTFRGKYLGDTVTPEQLQAIQDGTFKDLWLGDYWEIGGVKWRIVDFNYWYNLGNVAFTKNHLVIMPDSNLYNAQMNATATTNGGYINSLMYTTNLEQAKTIINNAFGNLVLTHKELLVNATNSGINVGGAFFDSTVELPNQIMIFGYDNASIKADVSTTPYISTNSFRQLSLFSIKTNIISRENFWIRDVVNSSSFVSFWTPGAISTNSANQNLGVRPVFAIGA